MVQINLFVTVNSIPFTLMVLRLKSLFGRGNSMIEMLTKLVTKVDSTTATTTRSISML